MRKRIVQKQEEDINGWPIEFFNEEECCNTPKRVTKFVEEWRNKHEFDFKTFKNPKYDQMVILRNIDFASLCAHHLLPFRGLGFVGYIPKSRIAGVSKLARTLDSFSCKPQLQENLTQNVADYLYKNLTPKGVMVVLDAKHDCVGLRGVKKPNAIMTTCAFRGVFKQRDARDEFMAHISRKVDL